MLKEHVVGKAIVEFHAQNICPMMCQICVCSEHRGIINVVCVAAVLLRAHEGVESGTAHMEWCKMVPSSQVCRCR